jgi:hypothetical protein
MLTWIMERKVGCEDAFLGALEVFLATGAIAVGLLGWRWVRWRMSTVDAKTMAGSQRRRFEKRSSCQLCTVLHLRGVFRSL